MTETQIVNILKPANPDIEFEDIYRKNGISNATYYNWKSKYGGMEANNVKRLKEFEDENLKLKNLSAEKTNNSQISDIKKRRFKRLIFGAKAGLAKQD